MADPKKVGNYLAFGGTALANAAPAVGAVSPPAGVAVAILGALAGLAGDVLQGSSAPVPHASDPQPLLDAMIAHWQQKVRK